MVALAAFDGSAANFGGRFVLTAGDFAAEQEVSLTGLDHEDVRDFDMDFRNAVLVAVRDGERVVRELRAAFGSGSATGEPASAPLSASWLVSMT